MCVCECDARKSFSYQMCLNTSLQVEPSAVFDFDSNSKQEQDAQRITKMLFCLRLQRRAEQWQSDSKEGAASLKYVHKERSLLTLFHRSVHLLLVPCVLAGVVVKLVKLQVTLLQLQAEKCSTSRNIYVKSRLKYLNCWMIYHQIQYRHSWSQRMNPSTFDDPLTFPLECSVSIHDSTAIGWPALTFGTDIRGVQRMSRL